MQCPHCDTLIAHGAKYCPSCGRKAPRRNGPPFAPDAHPANAPLPRTGKCMIAAGGAGLLILGAGIALRSKWLMIGGGALMLVVLLLLFVGDFIFENDRCMASHEYAWHHGNVHYVKKGMGDPLVLIHNLYPGADYQEYDHNIGELSRHFTVYAIDLLGFGQSDAPRIKYTADTYIELIFDFLRQVVAEPASVISAGLTCAYVTEVAAWRENLFKSLIFICPRSEPTGLDSPRWFAPLKRFFLTTPPLGSGFYETMAGEAELSIFLRDCFYSSKHVTKETVQRLHENAAKPGGIHAFASLVTGYLDRYLLNTLPRVTTPILLLWGRHARPAPVEHSVRVQAMARNSKLEVIEQAGAWPHAEQSAKVNQIIIDYLRAREQPALPPQSA